MCRNQANNPQTQTGLEVGESRRRPNEDITWEPPGGGSALGCSRAPPRARVKDEGMALTLKH